MSHIFRAAALGLGVPFVLLGYDAARDPGGRVALARRLGVPHPELAVRFNGVAMTLGGASLCLGRAHRAAATGLCISMIPTTVAGHAYWNETEPGARAGQRVQFLKNVGLAAGLVALAVASDNPTRRD